MTLRKLAVLSMVGWFGVSTGGCGEGSDGTAGAGAIGAGASGGADGRAGSAGQGGVPAVDLAAWTRTCERTAAMRCEATEECAPYLRQVVGDDCVPAAVRRCIRMVEDAELPFTPAEYERCVEASAAQSCDDGYYNLLVPRECLLGDRPAGAPCDDDHQCESGSCTTLSSCGVCERRAGLGETCLLDPCEAPDLVCGPELICIPAGFIGDPCSADEPCWSTLVCEAGICARAPGAGSPCSTERHVCDLNVGAFCDSDTLVCEPYESHAPGAECVLGICLGNTFCSTTTEPSTCIPLRLEGEPCSADDNSLICELGLRCEDGTCVRLNPERCD